MQIFSVSDELSAAPELPVMCDGLVILILDVMKFSLLAVPRFSSSLNVTDDRLNEELLSFPWLE